MSNRTDSPAGHAPITGRGDLLAVFSAGEKPRENWRIGTEHEKLVFNGAQHQQPSWGQDHGIRDLLLAFQRFGWEPVMEGENVIAMTGADGSLSLEPAGQFELSGAAVKDLHATAAEVERHRDQCAEVGAELGLKFLGLGFNPTATRAELPVMPKGRYEIMQRYMPKVGNLGLDMMLRTCTVQTNLDYSSEADMVQKLRVSLALQPAATGLFANSPFTEGQPNGYLSFRSQVWTDTDPDRTGMLPFVFEEGFGYEQYVDYALDVPMYFVFRDGKYIDVAGKSFRDFLEGKLEGLEGELPTIDDWSDHLTTIFPEVRLKSFLEMRGADTGPHPFTTALPAFWVGLLYDQTALDQAYDLIRGWTAEERQTLRDNVPELGLRAPTPDGRTMQDLAREMVALAASGLERRGRVNADGQSEAIYLQPLQEIAETGRTQADIWLDRFHNDWGGDITPIWQEAVY